MAAACVSRLAGRPADDRAAVFPAAARDSGPACAAEGGPAGALINYRSALYKPARLTGKRTKDYEMFRAGSGNAEPPALRELPG